MTVQIHPWRLAVGKPKRLDPAEGPHGAHRERVAPDHKIALAHVFERCVRRVEHAGVEPRGTQPGPVKAATAVWSQRLEVLRLRRLDPDHPVAHARVTARGRL